VGPILCASALALSSAACGSSDQEQSRNLPTAEVGMTSSVAPIFDDGETTIYEVKKGLQFPVLAPDPATMNTLENTPMDPYGRQPWVTTKDLKVQVSWTLTNVDGDAHNAELIIDPWNEFGRYWPGMQVTDAQNQELKPNLSGIDVLYSLEGSGAGDASRRSGTFTFADMEEMAVDFSTTLDLIAFPPPPPMDADPAMGNSNLTAYINHAFNVQNRSYSDVLINAGSSAHPGSYIPGTVAGLTGIDFGIRTSEPANVALEISVEVVDLGHHKVQEEGSGQALLPPNETVVTVGTSG
jgi:hypothetical protein